MTPRIGVTGSLAYDFLSTYDRPFDEVLLKDQLHRLSVCFVVPTKERHFGGTAGNVAYSLSLLGESPMVFAGVGYDFDDYGKRLKKLGVDVSALRKTTGLPTPCATIITDSNGNQITEFCVGAMGKGLKPHTKAFSTLSLLLVAPDDSAWMMDYVRLARSLRVPFFFDPGQNVSRFSREELLEAMEGAEGVFVNDYEFELFKAGTELDSNALLEHAPLFIVTHGERGATVYTHGRSLVIPAVTPTNVVNPTGCGDGFRAGFLKGYVEGRAPEVCGRMGSLLGAYVVEHAATQGHRFTLRAFAKRYLAAFNEDL